MFVRTDVSGMGALQIHRKIGFPDHFQCKKINDKQDMGGRVIMILSLGLFFFFTI